MYIKRLHITIMLYFVLLILLVILLPFADTFPKEGYIDRLEGEQAIILFEKEQVELHIPLTLLPEAIEEGTHIVLGFRETGKTGWRQNGP